MLPTTYLSLTRRKATLIALAATSALTVNQLSVAEVHAAEENIVNFNIANITDFHGHLKEDDYNKEIGAAKLQTLIKTVNEDTAYHFTTSGDDVGGSAFISAISEDKYTLKALNAMGTTAAAVGNHEFDQGWHDIEDRIQKNTNYPILGANVLLNGSQAEFVPPTHIEEISPADAEEPISIGYVGTVTQQTRQKVSPSAIEGIEFSDPVNATNEQAKKLKESGQADIVVALMHEDAERFAEDFSADVDILFGGDSHVRKEGQTTANGVHWAQGYEYGKILNNAQIHYDVDANELSSVEIKQYGYEDAKDLEPDAEIAGIVADAQEESDELGQRVVAELPFPLFRGSVPGGEPGSNRGVESTLNNLIAEAQRQQMNEMVEEPIDIGLMNAGGVRADLQEGEVAYQDAFTVQPFGNDVAYATVSGASLYQALENQWKDPEADRPRLDLGLSNNASYTYDPSAAQGERIRDFRIDNKIVDPNQDYKVAASTFLFSGGDGFFAADDIKDLVNVGQIDVQAFIDYLQGEINRRSGQKDVGVELGNEPQAGETLSINLSSLNYSTEGEPKAETVTVALGEEEVTADIDNTPQDMDKGLGEYGRATVELPIPSDAVGELEILITTDAGTEIVDTITVKDSDASEPSDSSPSSSGDSSSSSSPAVLSSLLGGGAVIATLAGLIAALGLNPGLINQASIDSQRFINKVEKLVAQFGY